MALIQRSAITRRSDDELREIINGSHSESSIDLDKKKLEDVRRDMMTLPEWEDYPCRRCDNTNPMECGKMCRQWEAWWKLRFRRCTAEGKRLVEQRETRKAAERRRKLAEERNKMYAKAMVQSVFKSD